MNVQTGAELDVTGSSVILVHDLSTVINLGTLQNLSDSFDAVSALGSAGGAGQNALINRGTIVTSGIGSEGLFNNAAAVTMLNDTGATIHTSGNSSLAMYDFASPGGGTLTNNGTLATSGDSSHGMAALTVNDTLVNNGIITTTGANAYGMFANGNEVGGAGHNTLTNHGTIDVSGLDAHGIVSLDPVPGVITNTGSIISTSSQAISSNGPFDIVINNTDTIAGGNGRAIFTDNGKDTFNWSGGTVTGFVRLDAGNDSATLTSLTDANLAAYRASTAAPAPTY